MKQKLQLAIMAVLTAAATTFTFADDAKTTPPPSVWQSYQDWQFQPVTINDPNSGENVRNQMDFTVPIHGPWLTCPAPDGMTVTWITRIKCAGGIEYREKGKEEWTALWPVKYGQIDYSRDLHSFHLKGLKPGTEYEYRLLSNLDSYNTAYHMVICTAREIYTFKTIDPKKSNYRVFVTADFHGGSRLCLDPMIDRTDALKSDMFFFLGDTVEDGMYTNIRYFTTFGFLDDITRKWGKEKPTVFLRGNHDINGYDTYQYGDYFPQPNERTYQAIAQGPVLFLCLDTMWPSKMKLQNEQHIKYLQEQVAWIKELKKTPVWKKAKFRIVMGHVAPFASEGTKFVGDVFNEVFSDNSKDGKIHAFLAGHEHAYWRINAGTKELRFSNLHNDVNLKNYPSAYIRKTVIPDNVPYTLVVCHLTEAMTIDVSNEKLIFQSHRYSKPDGGFYDAFEMYPDGSVKDLVETVSIPITGPAVKK